MKKALSGFTVVELIVVIVIIGILASITLVSYGGMQARTRNAQTVTSANQWLKTLKMYQSRNGGYPTMSTCLGEGYKYAANNQGNSGVGMCRQLTSTLGVVTDAPTVAALSKYSSTSQSPAMVSAVNGSSDWHRGVYYYINGTTATFNFVLDGKGASECPNPFANIALSQEIKATNGNIACTYLLGPVTGY